jgi:hypothetical protein
MVDSSANVVELLADAKSTQPTDKVGLLDDATSTQPTVCINIGPITEAMEPNATCGGPMKLNTSNDSTNAEPPDSSFSWLFQQYGYAKYVAQVGCPHCF